MRRLVGPGCLALLAAACGGSGALGFSADDNNPAALARAFQLESPPKAGEPENETGVPMAFMVAAEKPRKLIAWDLAANKEAWKVEADVTSRVEVGGSLVAHTEGKEKDVVVARDVRSGRELWRARLGAQQKFLGLAADGNRVFVVVQDDSRKRTWYLLAFENGTEVWRTEAPGTLGAPAARGGLVYMPFLTQWLVILDARTGEQLTRIRNKDEAINFVKTTSNGVYYGSRGVFALDEKSVSGTRQGATYGQAKLPEFVRTFYHFDAFQEIQAQYSAFDRNRILWRASASPGKLSFADDLAVVFSYRFFFAFDVESGKLKWAFHVPRADVAGAEHAGSAILYVTTEGKLGAIDPATGSAFEETKLGQRILGVTFDADGYRPAGSPEPARTVEALSSIVFDRDARFNSQKLFAVEALGLVEGKRVTTTLLEVIQDEKTPPPIYKKAAEVLVARKDPAGLDILVKALDARYDYITGERPRAVGTIARALGAIGKPEAAPALIAHLEEPETPQDVLPALIEALGKIGNRDAIPAVRTFLLLYRADPAFRGDPAALNAAVDALLALGGGAERELVAYVATDPRSGAAVRAYAQQALAQTKGSRQSKSSE